MRIDKPYPADAKSLLKVVTNSLALLIYVTCIRIPARLLLCFPLRDKAQRRKNQACPRHETLFLNSRGSQGLREVEIVYSMSMYSYSFAKLDF